MRARRTNFVSGGEEKPVANLQKGVGKTGPRPAVNKTALRPAVGKTGLNSAIRKTGVNPAMTTSAQRVVVPSRGFPWGVVVLLALFCGGGYYLYNQHSEKERQRLEAEATARQEAAAKVAREKQLAEEKQAAEKRTAKEAAERERLAKEKAEAEKVLAKHETVKLPLPEEVKKVVVTTAMPAAAVEKPAVSAKEMADAWAKMRAGEWAAAASAFKAAAKSAGEEEQENAKKLAAAADLYAKTVKETQLAVETKAVDLYRITLKNGTKIRGKYDKADSSSDTLVFLKDGNAKQIFTPREIAKREKITQAERDKEMLADIDERQKKAGDNAVALYLCGVKALEYDQKKAAIACMVQAVEKDNNIAMSVYEFLATRLFASAMLDRNLKLQKKANRKIAELKSKYPKSRAAMTVDGTLAEADALAAALAKQKEERKALAKLKKEEAIAARKAQREQKNRNKDLIAIEEDVDAAMKDIADKPVQVAEADKLATQANDMMRTAQTCDSRAVANRNYKEALANFRQAAALYQKMVDDKRADASVERKLDEVRQKMYWCRKLQTL